MPSADVTRRRQMINTTWLLPVFDAAAMVVDF